MTTERTYSENNDWRPEPAAEELVDSNAAVPPVKTDNPLESGHNSLTEPPAVEAQTRIEEDGGVFTPLSAPLSLQDDAQPLPLSGQEAAQPVQVPQNQDAQPQNLLPIEIIDTYQAAPPEVSEQFSVASETLVTGKPEASRDPVTQPFTSFMEQFRQSEGRYSPSSHTSEDHPFAPFVTNEALSSEATPLAEDASQRPEPATNDPFYALEQATPPENREEPQAPEKVLPPVSLEETASGLTQPTLPAERPVSPLLRPATRIRLPRHSRHRMGEVVQPAELAPAEPAKPAVVEQKEEVKAEPELPAVEEQPARPARRYRFDRPTSANGTNANALKTFSQPPASYGPETREKSGTAPVSSVESAFGNEPAPGKVETSEPALPEEKVVAQETVQAAPASETKAPVATTTERRRRGHQERSRDKEQQVAPVTPPVVETPSIEPETSPEPASEIPVEELPPLEYSELQAASSRRRRRRRTSSSSLAASNGLPAKTPAVDLASSAVALPKIVSPAPLTTQITPISPAMPINPVAPISPAAQVTPVASAYNIVSGYTVSQMNQGNDLGGPFMGPEPSPARGSTFNTTSSLRPVRNEALRNNAHVPAKQAGDPIMSSASVNYLASAVSQAIQTQTDRMVAELRRANQAPTNISVSLPPFPSNERVGVFVDVANLLYSARTLRMTVDFGKLLDFLRGNRRLVRAQAYCPTSPQASDDQMFLQAVKGLGYRITTKNYKTFSSGAKKADLDLDLCMDVVRLVDGRAVDCIVLVSGDSDFMPMLDYCSDHGVRVEVAAFDESMSATLRQSCDLFVNLSMLEEIRS